MKIKFEKLYRYDRIGEPCFIGIPVKKGLLRSEEGVRILDGDRVLPSQTRVTARHQDGSIKFLFVRFLTDLPGNRGKELECELQSGAGEETGWNALREDPQDQFQGIRLETLKNAFSVDCGKLKFTLENGGEHLFGSLETETERFEGEQFVGPVLHTDAGSYQTRFGEWKAVEQGPVCAIFQSQGWCRLEDIHPADDRQTAPGGKMQEGAAKEAGGQAAGGKEELAFECSVTAYAGKPWLDLSLRLINTTEEEQHIVSWEFGIKRRAGGALELLKPERQKDGTPDSTGCGDLAESGCQGEIFRTVGVKGLPEIQAQAPVDSVRTCVGRSNYKTSFTVGRNGSRVCEVADAKLLIDEANEQFAEVLYGTFFTDVTDERGGVCATVFQAQQNFPKAVEAKGQGLRVMLVPEGVDRVVMSPGMSREQRFLLHFHSASEPLAELDNRSLIYQMPDMPHLDPEDYRASGVFHDIFLDREKRDWDVEIALTARADGHARGYGMLNWGDAPDMGYTNQGRGGGRLVWSNNEYDYPHAMYLMYVRSGVRRFFDYANVAASHWMDVDVCHYSSDPLRLGGQWEHTFGHCAQGRGVMVCSHQWVEGLLDCYHFTGNERALRTALGIGENILKLLETPMYQVSGESNARETGWALRTLTALYLETWDEKWTEKCRWILGHFKEWTREYGEWVAPYTDNTLVRVGFMISVAVGSLMRYYRVFGGEDLRELILSAVDDLTENCLLDNGLFYYKELPSLGRSGSGPLLLESMAIGYELTGDRKYLEYGKKTFELAIRASSGGGGGKRAVEDTVLSGSGSPKSFAQGFIPLAVFYKAMAEEGML